MHSCLRTTMWRAFLFLACVAGYMATVLCDGEANPIGETIPIEETEHDGSLDGSRRCGCHPPICPKNEVYYNCSGGCIPRLCSEIGYQLKCDKKCTPGCVCKDNYVRADNGTCILISECPSCGGDVNAERGCGNNCGRTCSTYNKPPKPCPPGCIFNGCNCRKGYVYDNNVKSCVKPEDCTPICKVYEEYSPCTNGGCDAKNCCQIGKPVPCIKLDPKYCIKGCVCVKGYLRASNGTCVPKDQCTSYPPICPKNEVYYNCSGGCIPRLCSEIGFPLKCDKKCTPGCVCKDNYVRADNGTCIPIPDCKSCGGDNNAQQGCGNNCGRTCSTYNKPSIRCPIGCIFNGCNCRKGYVYDNNVKACVKPEDCTPTCGLNEVYSSCTNGGCGHRNCSQLGKPEICIDRTPESCTKGCVCASGYLRADNGTCVPRDKCPSVGCGGDPNAEPGCGYNCGRTCSSYKIKRPLCPRLVCKPNRCDCKDGYVFDGNINQCVLPKDCTPICKVNEEYSPCTNGGCVAKNCSQIGKPVPCIRLDPKYCIKGCTCVKGYLRASNGTCVPKDQCTPKCDKPNEVYDVCPDPCPGKWCNVNKILIKCAAPPKPGDPDCKPGCRCADNYYRNATGTCVLRKNCEKPLQCDRPNEVYDACPATCPAQECGVNPALILCQRPPEYGDPSCKPSCVCIDGYVRNNAKKCIPRDQCPQKCPVNEEYSNCINGGCIARNCSQVGKPVPCVKLNPKFCIKGCICVKGYLRAPNGTCVPKNKCPPKCDKPNEVYDVCPPPCPPKYCNVNEAVIKCAAPPKPGDPDCKPGCRCANNYYRNATGTCVLKKKCEKPLPCNRPNEVYDACPATCPTKECGDKLALLRCQRPPEYGDPSCKPSCVCIDGYVRNNDKKCIPRDHCPQNCPVNEVYSLCINGGCDARNCSQVGKPVPCVKLDPKYCIKGCICVKGYLRAPNGSCVPKNKCPPKCDKPNEVYDVCPPPCPPKYCNVNEAVIKCAAPPKPGDPDCKPGCRCANNYYRNATGTCVLKKKCEKPLQCDRPNEVYDACPATCPAQECGVNPALILCQRPPEYGDPSCKPSCVCIDGYVRNNAKKCIPRDQCPQKCPVNEVYSNCINGGCDARNCSQVGKPVPCVKLDPKYCIKGCICVKGYLRAPNGTCVPKNKCPPKCDKPNEVYDVCPPPCPPKYCNVNEAVIKCAAPPKPGDPDCKPGCRCANNYYRNATGTCVLKKKCEKPLPCNRPNEVYDACPATCPTKECGGKLALLRCQRPPEYGDPSCKPSCVCIDGYVRNNDKKCIPRDHCPQNCPVNEVYSLCINGDCDARNCSQVGKPVPCVKLDPKSCIKGCVCVKGYLRAPNGTCVPKDQCPTKCNKPNEVYDVCPAPCPGQRCNVNPAVIKCAAPPKPGDPDCMPGCRCADNYYRNATGTCVLKKNCEKPLPCDGPNQVYSACPPICPAQKCGINSSLIFCPRNPVYGDPGCKPSCICIYGYVRNDAKECIPKDKCPQNCPVNEVYSPCTNGGCYARNCSQVGKPVPCVKLNPKACIKGCVCVKGYLRAPNGTCVPKDRCTYYPPICPKNEVYYNCSGECIPRRCSEIGYQLKCDKKCTPGCVCKDNYVRADNGTCIPIPHCPSCAGDKNAQQGCSNYCGHSCSSYNKPPTPCPLFCIFNGCDCRKGFVYDYNVKACVKPEDCTPICKINEEYTPCINGGCDARNCSQIGKPVPCIKLDPKYCIKGCTCVKGYLRASNGTCVPKDQCTRCAYDPNAHAGCGVNCGRTCSTYKIKTLACILICKPNGCDCNARYVFDPNVNKCVLPKHCTPTCGLNEVYSSCTNGGCGHRNCSQLGKPEICIDRTPESCTKGCVCASGYLRADNGTCVPRDKCPSVGCGGDLNAQPGCGYNCGKTCTTYKAKRPFCPRIVCKPNGCDCKDGYVFDGNVQQCVLPKACTPICKVNEVYSPCVNGGCDARNCSQIGKPVPCIKLDPKYCIKGCICVKGYLRASNGTCVPKDQCTPRCYGKNEVWVNCIQDCSNQSCDDIGKIFDCPNQPAGKCKSGCRCVQGTWRNGSNVCVPQKECPKICGKNEHYEECYYSCGGDETCDDIGKKYSCPAKQKCYSGCRCDKGYWRNADHVCIPENQCPKLCGKNEYWEPCIVFCTNQSCAEVGQSAPSCPGLPGHCPYGSGCRCKPKYYRNSDGVCVPESECPRCYGQNEVWVYCIQGCSNQSCDDIGKIFHCPNEPAGHCRSGCRCQPGTWRNASNVCVPQGKCPTPDCPSGEVWNWCPAIACDGDYCAKTRNSPQTCPIGIVCDKPRCVCESNRKRDWKTGKCIRIQDCPKFKCDCNEEYQACPPQCPGDTCLDYINGPRRCPPYRPICRPQCRCIEDYYRDANGTCVPACDCPKETSITTTEPPGTSGGGTGLTGILDGITAFTGLCLYNRMKSAPSENIIMSAMSVFTPIAELCLYSKGPAYDQCIRVLNLKDKQDIRNTFPKLDASFGVQSTVNFSIANKIYSAEKYKLSSSFKNDAVDVFNASAEELDFSKMKTAADIINAWVESKTNNRIQDLVKPDMFSELTRIVLVNAIYFKGIWQHEFNKNNTKEQDFYLNDGTTKKTQMMGQEIKDLDYGEIPSLDCRAVRVYYKGKTSSMIIVLPNSKNGTLDLAKNLQDPMNWKKITDSFSPQRVQLYIPLFKITTTTDLKDLLKKANIVDWFNCENSGLYGLLEKDEKICITEAIQKAFVEVNELGAEAAAANAVVVTTRSLPLPPPVIKEFKANRAFLYYLEVGSVVALCGALNG